MLYAAKDSIPNAVPTRKRAPQGMGFDASSYFAHTQPIITVSGGAPPDHPIMQTATTVSNQGNLPSNIVAGGCSQLLPGFYVGAGNYVFAPDGTNTGDYIDPDQQRLFSSGLPLCHGGGSYQDLGQPTVLSLPSTVTRPLKAAQNASDALAKLEQQAQQACLDAKAITGNDEGVPLLNAWKAAKDWPTLAQALKDTADGNYNVFWQLNEAVGGAYADGIYQNQTLGNFVLAAITSYNHTPIAFNNVQAAVQCVYDELHEYLIERRLGSFHDAFNGMQQEVNGVSSALDEVTEFMKGLQASIARLPNPSPDIVSALKAAQSSIEALNALSLQVGSVWQVAQQKSTAAEAGAQDFSDPTAVEDADKWIHDAYPAVYGAASKAQALRSDIHSKLDGIASDVEKYIAQNPDKLTDPSKKTSSAGTSTTSHLALGLGLAAIALVAIKLKGAALLA